MFDTRNFVDNFFLIRWATAYSPCALWQQKEYTLEYNTNTNIRYFINTLGEFLWASCRILGFGVLCLVQEHVGRNREKSGDKPPPTTKLHHSLLYKYSYFKSPLSIILISSLIFITRLIQSNCIQFNRQTTGTFDWVSVTSKDCWTGFSARGTNQMCNIRTKWSLSPPQDHIYWTLFGSLDDSIH